MQGKKKIDKLAISSFRSVCQVPTMGTALHPALQETRNENTELLLLVNLKQCSVRQSKCENTHLEITNKLAFCQARV